MFTKTTPKESAPEPGKAAACGRTDAKWFYSILFFLTAMSCLLSYTALEFSDKDTVVGLSAHVYAALASPLGLDDETNIAQLRQALAAAKGEEIKPFPGLNVRVKESDISGLTPRQIRLFLFRQVGEPLYEHGEDGLKLIAEGEALAAMQKQGGAGIWGMLTEKIHDQLHLIFPILLGLAIGLLIGVIRFSRGFGKLVSPGLAMLFASLPGAFLTGWIRAVVEKLADGPANAGGGADLFGYLGYAVGQALEAEIRTVGVPYGMIILSGVMLLSLAFVGNGLVFIGGGLKFLREKMRKSGAKK